MCIRDSHIALLGTARLTQQPGRLALVSLPGRLLDRAAVAQQAAAEMLLLPLGPPAGMASLQALRRFESDATLSRNDRLGALYARVLLARLDQPKGPSTSRCPSRCSRRCASTWPVSIARSPPAMSARR